MTTFPSSRLKIKRANQHVTNLNSALQSFVDNDSHRLIVKKEADGRTSIGVQANPLPEMVPLILGDAIHNFRAALDIFYCELLIHYGQQPDSYSRFPFRTSKQELIAAMKGGSIKVAPQKVHDCIADEIQPYSGGDKFIYSLHQLDIMDKHMLIIPTVQFSRVAGICGHDQNNNRIVNSTCGVTGSGLSKDFVLGPTFQITNHGKATLSVLFPQGTGFEGEPLVPTLTQIGQRICGSIQAIVEAIEAP